LALTALSEEHTLHMAFDDDASPDHAWILAVPGGADQHWSRHSLIEIN
jgi:hypothetical protein